MPLVRKNILLAKKETIPGVEAAAFVAADAVEVLNAEFIQSRELIDRQPASQSLSPTKAGVGRGQGQIRFEADVRGGASSYLTDLATLLESCGLYQVDVLTLTTTGGGLSQAVTVGMELKGQTSGARGLVIEDAAASATTVKLMRLGTTTFGASEAVDEVSAPTTSIATTASSSQDTVTANTKGFQPISEHENQMAVGTWTGTPVVGETAYFSASGVGKGAGRIIATGTPLKVEWIWGTLTAAGGDAVATTGGATNSVAGTPAYQQNKWPWLTMGVNRHGLLRQLIGALGTFGFSAEAGNVARFTFEFTGTALDPTDETMLSPSTRNQKLPPRWLKANNSVFEIADVAIPVKSVEFSLNNEVTLRADANSAEGTFLSEVTDRSPSVTVTIDQVGLATKNFWTLWKNGTGLAVNLIADGGTANKFQFLSSINAQISEISDAEDAGIATHSITLALKGIEDDDEFGLIFS